MESILVVPTENKTVTLRQLTVEDAPAYFAAVQANPEHLSQFGDKTASNYPDLQSVIDSIADPLNPDKLRMGIWNGDDFVGTVSLTPQKHESDGAEIGYWLDERHTGHGYATIATKALSRYGLRRFGKVFAHVATKQTPDGERINVKSARVLERAGFSQIAKETGRLIFELAGAPLPEIASELVVRDAQKEDVEAIKPLFEHWMRDRNTGNPNSEEVSSVLAAVEASTKGLNGRKYIVAENAQGRVVGIMGMIAPGKDMQPHITSDNPIEFINAYVGAEGRGRGTGKILAKRLEELAIRAGYTEIIVNSGPRNEHTGGWAFWTRLYGEPVAIQKDLYGPGGDAPVWRKSLLDKK